MCFGVSYVCSGGCVNTYLNKTALAEGVVTGDGYGVGCSITCAEGIQDAGWGSTFNSPLATPSIIDTASQFVSDNAFLFLMMIATISAVILAYYLGKKSGGT